MSGYVADTSIFVAVERGDPVGPPPEGKARISVVTLTELMLGVASAVGDAEARLREKTLQMARRFVPLPYDELVSTELARLLAAARETGTRAPLADAIIAATALTHDLTVWSRDGDFRSLATACPDLRVHQT